MLRDFALTLKASHRVTKSWASREKYKVEKESSRQFSTNLDFTGLKELFAKILDDDATGAESPARGVDSYYRPGNFKDPSPIVYPATANGAVRNFKIQPNLIAILPVFRGHEEPYAHLREFFSIADTYQVNNTTKDRLAEEVHKREAGKLPSYPTLNPKHKSGGPGHVNMVTSLRNGKTYNNDIKIPSAHDFSHDVEDFVTDEEIIVEGKKADNVKSDSKLVNDLLKDFPKPPTHNSEATKSPKVGEGGVSSTITPYPAALEKSASARLAKKGPYSKDIRSIYQIPKGILEDVIVKVDDFYYLVDFFVMDTESPYKDVQPNIILGELRLNVFNSLNSPILKDCYHIDIIDECIQTHNPFMNLDRTLENLHYVDCKITITPSLHMDSKQKSKKKM
nr:hypothetical protein [Tanacetum cinerariifolium]